MGLDAVVYKNRKSLDLGKHGSEALVVAETGEIYFDLKQHYPDHTAGYFQAANVRIGNVSAVAQLLEEVKRLQGAESFIATRVLYSGSHSGDTIAFRELDLLAKELNDLAAMPSKSSLLEEFLRQMRDLKDAAQTNQNPIVFV